MAKPTGPSNASAVNSNQAFSLNKYGGRKWTINTVRGALVIAEAELEGKDVQINNVIEALKDVRSLLGPILIRHFNRRTGFKHIVGDFFPMLQRQTMDWLKQFRRRMSPRCSVKHPWQIIVEEKLPTELFRGLEAIVSEQI